MTTWERENKRKKEPQIPHLCEDSYEGDHIGGWTDRIAVWYEKIVGSIKNVSSNTAATVIDSLNLDVRMVLQLANS